MASCFRSRAAFGFLSVSSDSSRHHALYNFYFESEREAESDRFGLPAHPRSAAPKIAINFSSATEFSSWEGRHSGRARSEQRSPLLPFLFPPRFFCWRFEHAVGVSPSSLASIISIPSLSAFVAAGRSLVRSCRKLRRSDEPESCLSVCLDAGAAPLRISLPPLRVLLPNRIRRSL